MKSLIVVLSVVLSVCADWDGFPISDIYSRSNSELTIVTFRNGLLNDSAGKILKRDSTTLFDYTNDINPFDLKIISNSYHCYKHFIYNRNVYLLFYLKDSTSKTSYHYLIKNYYSTNKIDSTSLMYKVIMSKKGSRQVVIWDSTTVLTNSGYIFTSVKDSVKTNSVNIVGCQFLDKDGYVFSYGADSGIYRTTKNELRSGAPVWTAKNNGMTFNPGMKISCMAKWKNIIFASVINTFYDTLSIHRPVESVYISFDNGESWKGSRSFGIGSSFIGFYGQQVTTMYVDTTFTGTPSKKGIIRYAIRNMAREMYGYLDYIDISYIDLNNLNQYVNIKPPTAAIIKPAARTGRTGTFSISGKRIAGKDVKSGVYVVDGKIKCLW